MDLSTLGPSAAAVIVVVVFLRYMEKQEAAQRVNNERFIESIEKNTEVTRENMQFLRNLNGRLQQAVADKLKGK